MAFEKGLSRNILQQHIELTADELYYTVSETERVNVRTAIEDLISRVNPARPPSNLSAGA